MAYTCTCGTRFDLAAALDRLPPDQMGSAGRFVPACPGCGEQLMEISLRNGGFDAGYSYFGGSMHFEAVQRVRVKGMTITPADPDDLDVVIGERRWHFGIRHISRLRFCILSRAFAIGKRVDELDFAQWGVTLTGMEQDRVPVEYGNETVIQEGDFLWLSGPDPALTRAWHYLNDGKPMAR
jgi:hypothetical protein